MKEAKNVQLQQINQSQKQSTMAQYFQSSISCISTKKNKLKIVIVGPVGVGKTSLVANYVKKDPLPLTHDITINVDLNTKDNVEIGDQKYQINFWDCPGNQEYFRALGIMMLKNIDGILLVYSISQKQSFQQLSDWIEKLNKDTTTSLLPAKNAQRLGERVPTVLIGNKIDDNSNRRVSSTQAEILANQNYIKYIQTSVKRQENVVEAFQLLYKEIASRKPQKSLSLNQQTTIELRKKRSNKKKLCC